MTTVKTSDRDVVRAAFRAAIENGCTITISPNWIKYDGKNVPLACLVFTKKQSELASSVYDELMRELDDNSK